ncbi:MULTISPECIES: hypothetical protein [Pseudomonas]|uniref:hypothetical protein n=1 Tax=Pseudomonas TaxID=286 RepID=UPI0023614980|nr:MULTISPECIES: hypothetical protein [Pseudomonas]WJV25595.1 hypothetical protein PSR66_06020 [Pseudomonas chlororaphis]
MRHAPTGPYAGSAIGARPDQLRIWHRALADEAGWWLAAVLTERLGEAAAAAAVPSDDATIGAQGADMQATQSWQFL